jgi:large subunit ribosomal protein L17
MLRSQARALLQHERIETTLPRAKELRPFVERIITTAKRGLAAGAPDGRAVHARRLVRRDIGDVGIVVKLFDTIAPRFADRPGGYTRILRLGFRRGDAAERAQIELVGSEWAPTRAAEPTEEARPKSRGVGGRLRAAASRIRGGRKPVKGGESKPAKPTEGGEAKKAKTAKEPQKKGASSRAKPKSPKRAARKSD